MLLRRYGRLKIHKMNKNNNPSGQLIIVGIPAENVLHADDYINVSR